MPKPFLIYGVNGFTGRLCAEVAAANGLQPIVAGRNADAVRAVAETFSFPHRVFSLDDPAALRAGLEGVSALLLCAGPFSLTSRPALTACLELGVHYLDITGELGVFEACRRQDEKARAAGITVLPGVGFDVVPSDCLANALKAALPSADTLELAFRGGTMSKGTAKTALLHAGETGVARRGGELVPCPSGSITKLIPFRDKPRLCMNIPWGDISTAYQSTGIPNITVYMSVSPGTIRTAKAMSMVGPLLKRGPLQWAASKMIDRYVKGPDESTRKQSRSQFWGQVSSGDQVVTGTLTVPEGYTLTARTAVESARRVAAGETRPGSHTPATAFGADYITRFEDCELEISAAAVVVATSAV